MVPDIQMLRRGLFTGFRLVFHHHLRRLRNQQPRRRDVLSALRRSGWVTAEICRPRSVRYRGSVVAVYRCGDHYGWRVASGAMATVERVMRSGAGWVTVSAWWGVGAAWAHVEWTTKVFCDKENNHVRPLMGSVRFTTKGSDRNDEKCWLLLLRF